MRIYIGNLSFDMTEEEIRTLFEQYGTVDSVRFEIDRETGRFRNFGFVEMPNQREGENAISALNEYLRHGRNLKVSLARPESGRSSDRHRRY